MKSILDFIVSFFRGLIAGAHLAFLQVMKTIFFALVLVLGLTAIMWLLNIYGMKEVNYFFFFLGGMLVFFIGFNPATFVASVLLGAVQGGASNEGIIKGALSGPARLIHLIIGLLYAFFAISGLLATTSFAESPSSFFAILSVVLLLGFALSFYDSNAGKGPLVAVSLYVGYICIRAFWAVIPVETKWNVGIPTTAIKSIDDVIGTGSPRVRQEIDHLLRLEQQARDKIAENKARAERESQARVKAEREAAAIRNAEYLKGPGGDKLRSEQEEKERKDLGEKLDKAIAEVEQQ